MNAKCQPSEVCAPEDEVESLGYAFLAAIMVRDCDEAARYWSDEMHIEALEYCQKGIIIPDKVKSRCHLIEYKIEEGSRDDTTMGKRIIFSGNFTYLCEEAGNGLQTEDLKLFLREHAGGWEITLI